MESSETRLKLTPGADDGRLTGGLPTIAPEAPMVTPDVVRQIHTLAALRWGAKRIARELGLSKNTVKRYLRAGAAAETQVRPAARRLSPELVAEAIALFDGAAEGNAVVVRRLLAHRGVEISVRTCQEY